jgi:type VI protein secretion system component Hcp
MKLPPRPALLLSLLISAVQPAAAAVYLLIPGIPGDGTGDTHRFWIDVSSMQVGVANRICTGVTILKNLDRSSPLLSAAALLGTTYPSMTIDVTSVSSDRDVVLSYVLGSATVTSANVNVASSTSLSETITLLPATLTMTFTPSGGTPVTFTQSCKK